MVAMPWCWDAARGLDPLVGERQRQWGRDWKHFRRPGHTVHGHGGSG